MKLKGGLNEVKVERDQLFYNIVPCDQSAVFYTEIG